MIKEFLEILIEICNKYISILILVFIILSILFWKKWKCISVVFFLAGIAVLGIVFLLPQSGYRYYDGSEMECKISNMLPEAKIVQPDGEEKFKKQISQYYVYKLRGKLQETDDGYQAKVMLYGPDIIKIMDEIIEEVSKSDLSQEKKIEKCYKEILEKMKKEQSYIKKEGFLHFVKTENGEYTLLPDEAWMKLIFDDYFLQFKK